MSNDRVEGEVRRSIFNVIYHYSTITLHNCKWMMSTAFSVLFNAETSFFLFGIGFVSMGLMGFVDPKALKK